MIIPLYDARYKRLKAAADALNIYDEFWHYDVEDIFPKDDADEKITTIVKYTTDENNVLRASTNDLDKKITSGNLSDFTMAVYGIAQRNYVEPES